VLNWVTGSAILGVIFLIEAKCQYFWRDWGSNCSPSKAGFIESKGIFELVASIWRVKYLWRSQTSIIPTLAPYYFTFLFESFVRKISKVNLVVQEMVHRRSGQKALKMRSWIWGIWSTPLEENGILSNYVYEKFMPNQIPRPSFVARRIFWSCKVNKKNDFFGVRQQGHCFRDQVLQSLRN